MEKPLPPFNIIFWTRWFNEFMFDGNELVLGNECPVPDGYQVESTKNWCTISASTELVDQAAAVVFHAADYFSSQVPARNVYYWAAGLFSYEDPNLSDTGIKNQPWILETQESPHTALFRMESEKMKVFDYLASYHLRSAFLFSYYSPAIMDVANRPLPMDFMRTKTKKAPIAWIARNCNATSGRQHYVEELMKYIKVDSYGNCLNSQEFPEDKSKVELMGEYKFYLAIENANCDDYVTEKLFDTFAASTVPIVDGPDSYEGFIPDQKSIIRMDAFPDPRDLAKYISYLDENDDAYLEHLSFRKHALDKSAFDRLDASFIGNWSDSTFHNIRSSWCSVCRGILPWWKARVDPRAKPPVKDKNALLVDNSCWDGGKWNYAIEGPPYLPDWKPSPNPAVFGPKLPPIVELSPTRHSDMWAPLMVWTVEVILGALFMIFAAYMLYRQRRRSAKHEIVMSP